MEDKDNGKVIRVRNVPEKLHEEFKILAIREGMSMEALMLRLITEHVKKKGGK